MMSLMAAERMLGQSDRRLLFLQYSVFWVLSEHVKRLSKVGFMVERKTPPGKTFCFTALFQ